MFLRYKVTKTLSGGKATLFINKTKSIYVHKAYVTVPKRSGATMTCRDVTIERADGTTLGEETIQAATSEQMGCSFSDGFFLPYYDPEFIVYYKGSSTPDIIFEAIYEEVEFA